MTTPLMKAVKQTDQRGVAAGDEAVGTAIASNAMFLGVEARTRESNQKPGPKIQTMSRWRGRNRIALKARKIVS